MAEAIVIPTVVPSSLKDIENAVVHYAPLAPALHIDFTDGIFAPNVTWMPHADDKLPAANGLLYEVHLMMHNPRSTGLSFARAGAKRIIAHVEAFPNPSAARHVFDEWKKAGAHEIGLAVLIDTPLSAIEPYRAMCDEVLLMAIAAIGRQGASFDERVFDRIKELHEKHEDLLIGVDGGISEATIAQLARAGASRFRVGKHLASAADRAVAYARLKSLAESAIQ